MYVPGYFYSDPKYHHSVIPPGKQGNDGQVQLW